jgi:hypothetical protein
MKTATSIRFAVISYPSRKSSRGTALVSIKPRPLDARSALPIAHEAPRDQCEFPRVYLEALYRVSEFSEREAAGGAANRRTPAAAKPVERLRRSSGHRCDAWREPIVNAKLNTVRVAEIKFRAPAAQMMLAAVLRYIGHISLEDAVIPLHGVGVDLLAGRIGSVDGQRNNAWRTHR